MKPPPTEKAPARPAKTAPGRNQTTCGKSSISATDGKRKFDAGTLDEMRHRLPEFLTAAGVELRRNGTRLVGRCPCHEDSTPSLAVYGAKLENCGCFPCGHSGDVFATAQWMGRAGSFPEAVADVAAVLGVYLPDSTAGTATRPATQLQRPAKQPEPPFILSTGDREKIHTARLAFSDACDAGNIDPIAAELGLPPWVFRWAAKGESGLGLWKGRLAYLYPAGMKLRNPAGHKPRFQWECGRALAPWRAEWIRPETETVYLTEGESDCLALIAAGLEADGTAVCVASPGTSFPQTWASLFAGKRVTICFDLDPPGMAAAAKVAGMLKGHAAEILTWKGAASHE